MSVSVELSEVAAQAQASIKTFPDYQGLDWTIFKDKIVYLRSEA